MRLLLGWTPVLIISALGACLVNFMFPETPLRPLIVFWFIFVCPGMSLVRFIQCKEIIVEWTLAIALSFSIDAIIASIQLYTGNWSPQVTLIILIMITLFSSVLKIFVNMN